MSKGKGAGGLDFCVVVLFGGGGEVEQEPPDSKDHCVLVNMQAGVLQISNISLGLQWCVASFYHACRV